MFLRVRRFFTSTLSRAGSFLVFSLLWHIVLWWSTPVAGFILYATLMRRYCILYANCPRYTRDLYAKRTPSVREAYAERASFIRQTSAIHSSFPLIARDSHAIHSESDRGLCAVHTLDIREKDWHIYQFLAFPWFICDVYVVCSWFLRSFSVLELWKCAHFSTDIRGWTHFYTRIVSDSSVYACVTGPLPPHWAISFSA